ncbi:hypothetical protein RN346_01715 [Halomonas sp. PAMB 3232]|uniref:hypothetical protein n=1 Tax=Halomonas sp. PAMB 3232 TaxID=3075221 RepID=UPI002898E7AB|nr:hypothetical protein [Halomonas sp. PAMB 3232]WNL39297.1 hypothetical protein RN346_01715 [Halomonas sp. PAMB 3232]
MERRGRYKMPFRPRAFSFFTRMAYHYIGGINARMFQGFLGSFGIDIDGDARRKIFHLTCLAQYAAAKVAGARNTSFYGIVAFKMVQVIHG